MLQEEDPKGSGGEFRSGKSKPQPGHPPEAGHHKCHRENQQESPQNRKYTGRTGIVCGCTIYRENDIASGKNTGGKVKLHAIHGNGLQCMAALAVENGREPVCAEKYAEIDDSGQKNYRIQGIFENRLYIPVGSGRSEERRVGKECRL